METKEELDMRYVRNILLTAPKDSPLIQSLVKIMRDFIDSEIGGWTPTAIELWCDKEFIKRRIEEQKAYLANLAFGFVTYGKPNVERRDELYKSAYDVCERFHNRLKELNSGVA